MADTDLSHIPTLELAKILAARPDLTEACLNDEGRTNDSEVFTLRKKLGAIACTDLVPVFEDDDGVVWGGCITRGDVGNPFYGKHAYIGGIIGYGKTINYTMKYHAKVDTDLNVELPLGWEYPERINQYFPADSHGQTIDDDFLPEWDKHSVAPLYLAFITGDASNPKFGNKSGKQEALGFLVYTLDNCPPESEWAYGQRAGWIDVVQTAIDLRDGGVLKLPKLPEVAVPA